MTGTRARIGRISGVSITSADAEARAMTAHPSGTAASGRRTEVKRTLHCTTGLAGLALLLAVVAPSMSQPATAFDLEALVEKARSEPPITVYAVTGKIVETAEAFSKKYGVTATGRKVNEAEQIELLLREGRAGNVVGDVSVAADVAAIAGQLIPSGLVQSWVPQDLAGNIPPAAHDPLVIVT